MVWYAIFSEETSCSVLSMLFILFLHLYKNTLSFKSTWHKLMPNHDTPKIDKYSCVFLKLYSTFQMNMCCMHEVKKWTSHFYIDIFIYNLLLHYSWHISILSLRLNVVRCCTATMRSCYFVDGNLRDCVNLAIAI